jgi:hypothetical protein
MPLRHLIALIINVQPHSAWVRCNWNCNGGTLIRKTSFASRSIRRRQRSSFADLTRRRPRPMDEGLGRKHVCRSAQNGLGDCKPCGSKPLCRSLGTISSSRCQTTRDVQTLRGEAWMQARISFLTDEHFIGPPLLLWSHGGQPSLSKSGLPTEAAKREVGGARRDRTDDLLLAKQALSQLSYGPSLKQRPPSHMLRRATFAVRRLANRSGVSREGWWAWEDLNFRPHAYQARALTN